MWEKKQYKSENWQEFSRIKDGMEERLRTPITIDDGRYEVVDILSNSGGFGVIYKAKDKVLHGRDVLVKARKYGKEGLFVYEYNGERERRIDKIRKETLFEAKTLCSFKSNKESRLPNVNNIVKDFSPELRGPHKDVEGCTFYYDNEDVYNNEPYIVMQVIEGENLLDYAKLEREKFSTPMWEIKVLEITKEIATILRSIHKRQNTKDGRSYFYIYRDLKPDNIMITEGKYLTLLDFGGVGLVLERENGEFISNEEGFGAINIHTPGYCAPEAYPNSGMEKRLDQRVDIYSLGVTMFQLLVGGSINELVDPRLHLPLLEKLDGKCSTTTRELIERCVMYDREDRYTNMKEINDYLVLGGFKNAKEYWKEEGQVQV